MKITNFKNYLARIGMGTGTSLCLIAGTAFGTYVPANPENNTNVPPVALSLSTEYTEDFDGFAGSLGTLPDGFFVESDQSSPFGGNDDGSGDNGGFISYGNSSDRAFGILERGDTIDLRDGRIYFKFTNNTGATMERVRIRYRMEQWRDGDFRVNQIRMKANDESGGFSSQPELVTSPLTDAVVTANNNQPVNGNANYRDVDVIVQLNPAIPNGEEGYIRWQFSTLSGDDDRDGLSIDEFGITALPSGDDATYVSGTWQDGQGTWTGVTGGLWDNDGDYNALFTSAGTISLGGNIDVLDIDFLANGIEISGGANTIAATGLINVANSAHTAEMNAILAGSSPVTKIGDGILELQKVNTFTGGLSILDGTVKPTVASAIPVSNRINLSGADAVFDLNGQNVTIAGLVGTDGEVVLGSSTLTIDNTLNADYRGELTGSGDVIKTGSGTQKFLSQAKAYTGDTIVRDGTLEITDDGLLTGTSSILVNDADGQGELALVNDESSIETYTFPVAIQLAEGYLRAESDGGVELTSGVTLVSGVNRIYSSGDVDHEFHIDGAITGSGNLRKNGTGILFLNNASNTYTGETDINNGTVVVPATGSLGGGKLWLTDPDENRELILQKSVTVAGLEGNSMELPDFQTGYITLDGNVTFTINQGAALDEEDEEIKPSYQGDFREETPADTGIVVKTGLGTTRLTRQPKAFTGHFEVNNGVLEVSESGQFTNVAEIEVNSGGQLRLTSGTDDIGDPVVYDFGGDVVLRSMARSLGGVIEADSGFGELGGLRFDANSSEGELYAELASDVDVAAASDIHVNGSTSVLFLSGALSGSANLERTGGGALVIEGSASGYTGTMTLTNGITALANGTSFGGSIVVNADELHFDGSASIGGSLDVNSGVVKLTLPGTEPLTPLIPVGGSVDLGANVEVDLDGTGAVGLYQVFGVTGTGTVDGTVTVINPPSGLSASIFEDSGIIYVELQ